MPVSLKKYTRVSVITALENIMFPRKFDKYSKNYPMHLALQITDYLWDITKMDTDHETC